VVSIDICVRAEARQTLRINKGLEEHVCRAQVVPINVRHHIAPQTLYSPTQWTLSHRMRGNIGKDWLLAIPGNRAVVQHTE